MKLWGKSNSLRPRGAAGKGQQAKGTCLGGTSPIPLRALFFLQKNWGEENKKLLLSALHLLPQSSIISNSKRRDAAVRPSLSVLLSSPREHPPRDGPTHSPVTHWQLLSQPPGWLQLHQSAASPLWENKAFKHCFSQIKSTIWRVLSDPVASGDHQDIAWCCQSSPTLSCSVANKNVLCE